MGTKTFLLAGTLCALLASPSVAKDGTQTVRRERSPAITKTQPAVDKKLREAKRGLRMTVIPTDVRQKRYLAFGDELGAQPGGVLTRRTIGGDAISDGP